MSVHHFKLHRPQVLEVINCLKEIFQFYKPADKVIERCFKSNPKLGKRDRAFIAEQVYDITRNYVLISACVPEAENFWSIAGAWLVIKGQPLPDWPEFKNLSNDQIQKNLNGLSRNPALKWSVPPDLDEYGKQALGVRWYVEMEAMHRPAPLVIRINTIKATPRQVTDALNALEIRYRLIPGPISDALIIEQRINLFSTPLFKQGWVEVQDYSSQQVGLFVAPVPGMRIVDACAGGGGKSLHLAALMGNKGRIISMDIEEYKLNNLKLRAKRAGAGIIESRWIENKKTIKRLEGSADKVLLDVPCSGSGVLRRNPDAKYRLGKEYIHQLIAKQQFILDEYCEMVKAKGELIYVTCSIFPDENEYQIEYFLKNHPEFELVQTQQLWPSECGFDGFFMAKMRKRESAG